MRSARSAHGRAGFTLLELLVSATVFMLVAGAVGTTIALSTALGRTNRETALAARAAQSLLEELKGAAEFGELYARYNATSGDDPAGGTSPGWDFAVRGLQPRSDDGDGFVGRVEFPGTGKELLEDGDDDELGLPRDLDGDGAIDGVDHAGDYRILPVRVVIEWEGQKRARSLALVTVLTEL